MSEKIYGLSLAETSTGHPFFRLQFGQDKVQMATGNVVDTGEAFLALGAEIAGVDEINSIEDMAVASMLVFENSAQIDNLIGHLNELKSYLEPEHSEVTP